MKMSPWRSQGVLQTGFAVKQRDASVQGLIDLNFGAGKAEALALLRDLEALTLPLHDVVVTDHALMNEAADAVQIFRGRTPGGLHFAGPAGEAAVEVGDEDAQHGVGGIEIVGLSEAEFAAQTILEHAPEAFDATFGLRTASGDEGDAELLESASELGGLTFSGELFFHRPEVVVAYEDAAVIAIEGERDTAVTQQLAEQGEIAGGGFGGEELSGEDFPGGIVLQAEGSEARAAAFEPIVGRAIQLHQFTFAGGSQTALTMGGSAAFTRRADAGLAQESAEGFPAEPEALDLAKFFAEVMIVEASIGGAGQANHGLAHPGRQTAGAGSSAVGVRHVSLNTARNYAHSLQFLLTQRECPSSQWGDIFTLLLGGDRIMELKQPLPEGNDECSGVKYSALVKGRLVCSLPLLTPVSLLVRFGLPSLWF